MTRGASGDGFMILSLRALLVLLADKQTGSREEKRSAHKRKCFGERKSHTEVRFSAGTWYRRLFFYWYKGNIYW